MNSADNDRYSSSSDRHRPRLRAGGSGGGGGSSRPSFDDDDLVFGLHAVLETLRSGRQVDRILINQDGGQGLTEVLRLAKDAQVPVQRVPLGKINQLTKKNHQGVVCFTSPVHLATLEEVVARAWESGRDPLLLVLDGVTDVRNFGAIVRTAECAGVHGIIVPTKGSSRISSDAMKTSAGALNFVPIVRVNSLVNTLIYLKDSGINVVACSEKESTDLYQADLSGPQALVMGDEGTGIQSAVVRLADQRVRIPMLGRIESLNVGVAAGILVFEVNRQRGG